MNPKTNNHNFFVIAEADKNYREALKQGLLILFPLARVEEAQDEAHGLALIRQSCPFLMIVDAALPGGSGLNFSRKIKDTCGDTKIIVLAVDENPEYLKAAAEEGISCFSIKEPMSAESVVTLIRSCM